MDVDFLGRMKQKLQEAKAEIISNLVHEDEDFREMAASLDQKDVVDIASTDIDKKLLSALGAQEVKRLRLIESALVRIENGKYGYCLKSGKPIPKERLEAIPYALYTIEAQNDIERRRRQG